MLASLWASSNSMSFPIPIFHHLQSSWLRAQIFELHSLTSLFPFQNFVTFFLSRDESFSLLEGGMSQPSCSYIQGNQDLPSSFYTTGPELGGFTFLIYF